MKIISLLLALGLAFLFGSCFSMNNGEPKKNRGSLSDAMEKAKDGHEDDRTVDAPVTEEPQYEDDFDSDEDNGHEGYTDGSGSESDDSENNFPSFAASGLLIGVEGRYNHPYQDSLKVMTSFALEAGTIVDNIMVLLRAGYENINLTHGGTYFASVRDPMTSLFVGGELRYTPFVAGEPFNPYLLAAYEQGIVMWTFQNPIISGGDTISSDAVITYNLTAGIGINIIKSSSLNIFLNTGFRFRLYNYQTTEGFDNDYFNSESFYYISGEVLFRFE